MLDKLLSLKPVREKEEEKILEWHKISGFDGHIEES